MVESGGLRAVEQRAMHEAQRRKQRPSTAHVLLVLYQRGGDTAARLTAAGLREPALLSALKATEGDAPAVLERVFDRARKHAHAEGGDVREEHLLRALLADSRTQAHRMLAQLGLELDAIVPQARAPEAPPTKPPPPRMPLPPVRASHRSALVRPLRGATSVRTPPGEPQAGATSAVVEPGGVRSARPVVESAPRAASSRPAEAEAPKNVRRVARAPEGAPRTAASLDPSAFPVLCAIGRNLSELACEGRLDDAPGRAKEIERLLDVLARRRANNPILVGPPGVGKTAVVEALALRLARSDTPAATILVEVSAGTLTAGTGVRGALGERLRKLRAEVAGAEGRVVLFFDEIHTLVAGADGAEELAQELKAALARGELPCIGATTDVEYRKVFERDAALARRFSPVLVDEPSPADAETMIRAVLPTYAAHHGRPYDDDAARAAVELTVRFVPDRRLPDKAVAALDQAGARAKRRGLERVGRADVAAVVAEWAGLSVDRILLRDKERLLSLEHTLAERVVGHAAALTAVADALRKGAAGFRGKRPLSTFLFLGSTGVGKTELAKAISDAFFGGGPMTRIDMSELSEAHAVARLFGAPPGYVGHDDGGQLTESVRKRPYQLVLLDEVEKAHPEVLLALLPLLDEGRVTDGKGRTVDFTNTVVVMTSNLGVKEAAAAPKSIGFGARDVAPPSAAERTLAAARRALPPELWNRIDEPLHFEPLRRDEVAEIARRMLTQVAAAVAREHGIAVGWQDDVVGHLLDVGGFDPALGARPMRRVVGRDVEAALARYLLERGDAQPEGLTLVVRDGVVVVQAQASGQSPRFATLDAAE